MSKSKELEKFDEVMCGLLAIPYSELKKKLEEENRRKKEKKQGRLTSLDVSRVSSELV
jgi:hypothetical protein